MRKNYCKDLVTLLSFKAFIVNSIEMFLLHRKRLKPNFVCQLPNSKFGLGTYRPHEYNIIVIAAIYLLQMPVCVDLQPREYN